MKVIFILSLAFSFFGCTEPKKENTAIIDLEVEVVGDCAPGTRVQLDGKDIGTVDSSGKFHKQFPFAGPHTVELLDRDGRGFKETKEISFSQPPTGTKPVYLRYSCENRW